MNGSRRFWAHRIWESICVELMVAAVFLVVTLMRNWGMDGALLLSAVPIHLISSAAISIFIINLSTQSLYSPLLLAMGQTRRHVFLGSCCHRMGFLGVTLILCGVFLLWHPGEISAVGWRNLGIMLMAASSAGNIFGGLYYKWRWVGAIGMILFGGTFGVIGSWLFHQKPVDVVGISGILHKLPGWIILAVVFLLMVDLILHWLLLRRQEVKF